jgi:hypothetical protein
LPAVKKKSRHEGFRAATVSRHVLEKEQHMVRAKFKMHSYTTTMQTQGTGQKNEAGAAIYKDVEMRTLKFGPVYGNGDPNHENTRFWNATPSGSIELGTVNKAAWEQFEIGKEYYIDFSPVS